MIGRNRPTIRLSAALAAALWPEHRGATRAVTVERVTVRRGGAPGGRRPQRRGGGGVYRGGLFRKTVIRDLMMRPIGLPKGPERNARKRQRRAQRQHPRGRWASVRVTLPDGRVIGMADVSLRKVRP